MKKNHFILAFGLACSMLVTAVSAQRDKSQRESPPATAQGKIGSATVTIDYSSPSVKGRKIGVDIAPYGKPWRAGANEATTLQTDKPITVEGKALPAGKYSLFAIPGEKQWTIILNSEVPPWGIKRSGEANFDPAKNVVSVNVKPSTSAKMNEKLVYEVKGSGIALLWGNVDVPVSIK